VNRSPARIAPLLAWLSALAAGALLLAKAGEVLPTPPAHPTHWGDWAATTHPVAAAFGGLRLIGLALCAYLLATTTLSLLAAASGVPHLLRAVDLVTLPVVRALVRSALGVGVAASIAWSTQVGPALAQTGASAGGASGTAVMHLLDAAPTSTATTVTGAAPITAGHTPPTMSTTPTATPRCRRRARHPRARSPASLRPADTGPTPAPGPARVSEADTWTIAPGDHVWRVAERTLAGAWERPPTDAETSTYLGALIEANHDRLVVPGHPDLVYAGQVFALPTPPPR